MKCDQTLRQLILCLAEQRKGITENANSWFRRQGFIDTDFVIRHSFLLQNSTRTYCSYAFIVGIQWLVNSQLYAGLSLEKGPIREHSV